MAKFTCPKCDAKVEKEAFEAPGCPCCGYCGEQQFVPNEHVQIIPTTIPWIQPGPWIAPTAPWEDTGGKWYYKSYWTSDQTTDTMFRLSATTVTECN